MSRMPRSMKQALAVLGAGIVALAVAGCGGSNGSTGTGAPAAGTSAATTTQAAAAKNVLPVATNPIANPATAPGLTITKALVENNISPANGKTVDDHLEFVLKNSSAKPLGPIEIYYKITDPSKGTSEGYHTVLAGLTIKPGASRAVHFDNSGAADHFPVNKYSLYYLDKNALRVDIEASVAGVKPARFAVRKDAGGAEAGVESGSPTG